MYLFGGRGQRPVDDLLQVAKWASLKPHPVKIMGLLSGFIYSVTTHEPIPR